MKRLGVSLLLVTAIFIGLTMTRVGGQAPAAAALTRPRRRRPGRPPTRSNAPAATSRTFAAPAMRPRSPAPTSEQMGAASGQRSVHLSRADDAADQPWGARRAGHAECDGVPAAGQRRASRPAAADADDSKRRLSALSTRQAPRAGARPAARGRGGGRARRGPARWSWCGAGARGRGR